MSLMELLACAAQTESVRFPPFHMCHLSLLERDCWVGRKAASVWSSTIEIQIFAFSGPEHSPERPRQPHPLHRRQCPRWVSRGRTRWWGGERVVESTSGPSLTTSCVTGGVAFTSLLPSVWARPEARQLLYRASLLLLLRSGTFRETGVDQEALILAQTHPSALYLLKQRIRSYPYGTP